MSTEKKMIHQRAMTGFDVKKNDDIDRPISLEIKCALNEDVLHIQPPLGYHVVFTIDNEHAVELAQILLSPSKINYFKCPYGKSYVTGEWLNTHTFVIVHKVGVADFAMSLNSEMATKLSNEIFTILKERDIL